MVQGTPHRLAAAAVGVFLGDGDDEAQVRLHHLLLGLARLALAICTILFDIRLSSRATAVPLGEPHQAAFVADQALVDVVELLDQRVDARMALTSATNRAERSCRSDLRCTEERRARGKDDGGRREAARLQPDGPSKSFGRLDPPESAPTPT